MVAVAAMLTALRPDVVAEEPSEPGPGVGDQGLLGGQCEPEVLAQEVPQSGLDLLGFIPRSGEPQEEVVRVPDVPEAAIARVKRISRADRPSPVPEGFQ